MAMAQIAGRPEKTAVASIPAQPAPAPTPVPRTIDKQSLDYVCRSGLAGGLAGCAAKTLVAPLDRVKILFQTRNPEFQRYSGSIRGLNGALRFIFSTEGVIGWFRGHSATLLRVFPYAGIRFVAYEQYRNFLIPSRDYEIPWRRFLAGSAAGVTSVFLTYPLDVIRVQLAYDTSHTSSSHKLLNTVRTIAHQSAEGSSKVSLRNFYPGFVPTVLGMIPYAGTSFLTHDSVHDLFRSRWLQVSAVDYSKAPNQSGRRPLKNWAQLTAGGISGLLAQTASYPLEIIRRRMQVAGLTNQRLSLGGTIATIYKESGARGFFVGLSIGYIKVVPMFACSFFVYEKAKYWVGI